jgi:hypothetical protein
VRRPCLHKWYHINGLTSLCLRCEREGMQWYDFISGGVDVVRGVPTIDLRVVHEKTQARQI